MIQAAACRARQNRLDLDQGLLERQMARRLSTRGLKVGSAGADQVVAELHFRPVVEALDQLVQGIGPSLNGIANDDVRHRQLGLQPRFGSAGRRATCCF